MTAAGAASKWTSGRAVAMTLSSKVTHVRIEMRLLLWWVHNFLERQSMTTKTENIYSDKKDTITKKIRKSRESEKEK